MNSSQLGHSRYAMPMVRSCFSAMPVMKSSSFAAQSPISTSRTPSEVPPAPPDGDSSTMRTFPQRERIFSEAPVMNRRIRSSPATFTRASVAMRFFLELNGHCWMKKLVRRVASEPPGVLGAAGDAAPDAAAPSSPFDMEKRSAPWSKEASRRTDIGSIPMHWSMRRPAVAVGDPWTLRRGIGVGRPTALAFLISDCCGSTRS
mmetsp:Transcript_14739/g.55558  ORF Transcript_14739/g.55558 Transcript_14739/m.55558 type:complete len:203 (+) Transcript_14739:3279-3887(+)